MVDRLKAGKSDKNMVEAFPPSNIEFSKKKTIVHNLRARIVANDPALKGLLTFVPHNVVKDDHYMFDQVAYTDGDEMYFADKFFSMEIPVQCAVILHEMFHIVFRHINRGKNRIPRLWNIACDAIINDSIGYKENASLNSVQPVYLDKEHCVSLDSLYEEAKVDYKDRKPVHAWTSEALYEFLIKNLKDKLEEKVKNQQNQQGKGEGEGEDSQQGQSQPGNSPGSVPGGSSSGDKQYPDTELGRLEKEIDELYDKLAKKHKMFSGDDMKEGESKDKDPVNEQVNDAKWTQRYNRAKSQGMGSTSILGRVNPDVYQPQIPWYKELRKYLVTRCMPLTEQSWTRPARRMASLRNRGNKTYLPGIEKQKGLDKMMVIIDTSGSCFNEEELTMFCSEIESVQNQTGVEIALIFADTEIKAEYIVKADGTGLLDKIRNGWINAQGGGGTDMVAPFVEGKKKYKPILTVIASDGYTGFPTPQQIRGTTLLWIINTSQEVPKGSGKALYIKPQS